jgi:hypothetical protein
VVEGRADQPLAALQKQRRPLTSTGPSFIAAWSNADVAVVALAAFAIAYGLCAAFTATWLVEESPGDGPPRAGRHLGGSGALRED